MLEIILTADSFKGKPIFEPFFDLCIALDQLHRTDGGSGLKVDDIFQGIGIEQSEINYRDMVVKPDSGSTHYTDRAKVYEVIRKKAISDSADKICRVLDETYPEKVWSHEFPTFPVLMYLLGDHYEHFCK